MNLIIAMTLLRTALLTFSICVLILSPIHVSGQDLNLVNLDDYQRAAKQILDRDIYDWAAGAGFYELTSNRNRVALQSVTLWPRYLRDVSQVDMNVTVLRMNVEFPIGMSPTAFQRAFSPRGELATAKACGELGNIFILSFYSTSSIEEVAEAAGPRCRKWMNLYPAKNRSLTMNLVRRAERSGFEAIVLTVDSVNLGRRYRDRRWRIAMSKRYPPANIPYGKFEGNPSATWSDVRWLRMNTDMAIVVKGIIHPLDARQAVKSGADAVYVSNHGGRQLDTVSPTIDVLREIVKEVRRDGMRTVDVYTDGGYRTGTDVIKAYSMGANYVFLGRPTLFMLAVNGTEGVKSGYRLVRDELYDSMQLSGYPTLSRVDRALTKKCYYPTSDWRPTGVEPLEAPRGFIAGVIVGTATRLANMTSTTPPPSTAFPDVPDVSEPPAESLDDYRCRD